MCHYQEDPTNIRMFMEVAAIYRLLSVSLLRWLVTVYCNHGAAALTTTLHGTPRGRVEGLQRGITIMLLQL